MKPGTRVGLDLTSVIKTLKKLYKPPVTFLEFRTPLDLLVATVLSAQCTDKRVNIVTQTILYPKYNTAKDYAEATRKELERDIQSCGTYRNKAKFIQQMANILIEKHGGQIPQTMGELTALPGVGRKTATIVLKAAFGKIEGVAVDTHVFRVARRLGLSKGHTPEKVELDLLRAPRKEWAKLTTLLISHGRAICIARKRRCDICPFMKDCPSSWMQGRKDLTEQDSKTKP